MGFALDKVKQPLQVKETTTNAWSCKVKEIED